MDQELWEDWLNHPATRLVFQKIREQQLEISQKLGLPESLQSEHRDEVINFAIDRFLGAKEPSNELVEIGKYIEAHQVLSLTYDDISEE